jgi:hypothetical protein
MQRFNEKMNCTGTVAGRSKRLKRKMEGLSAGSLYRLVSLCSSLSCRQLKKRANSFRSPTWLRPARRASESLISNKCPSSTQVALNSLPRCEIISGRCSKRIPHSEESGPTVRTMRAVIQRLIPITNPSMRRALENSPARDTNKCRCQLSLHAHDGGPSLATWPTGRFDCNSDALAGFAAAPCSTLTISAYLR